MNKPIVADIEYGPGGICELRKIIIDLKGNILSDSYMEWAISLGYTIGLLECYAKELE